MFDFFAEIVLLDLKTKERRTRNMHTLYDVVQSFVVIERIRRCRGRSIGTDRGFGETLSEFAIFFTKSLRLLFGSFCSVVDLPVDRCCATTVVLKKLRTKPFDLALQSFHQRRIDLANPIDPNRHRDVSRTIREF